VTLYCDTQIYTTLYLAQMSVSPCSNRLEAMSFHSQVGPSGKTLVWREAMSRATGAKATAANREAANQKLKKYRTTAKAK